MKFEKFIVTFVMMNIVVLLSIVFTGKNHLIMQHVGEMIYGSEVQESYFSLSPQELQYKGFQKDSDEQIASLRNEIVTKTHITNEMLGSAEDLAPYDKAVALVKMFSLMGDGNCKIDKTIIEKINLAEKKEICAKDASEIFLALAEVTGLNARMVSNGTHYAAEFYNGTKWVYIDPYFAMTVSSEDDFMSFSQFADGMLHNGWMKFNYFGGENHCMNGKQIADHPYFGDKGQFAWISTTNGNNVIKMVELENKYGNKPAFIKYIAPYKNGYPKMVYTEFEKGQKNIINKYVAGLLAVFGLILLGTNIVLPAYFVIGLATKKKK